MDQPIDYFEKSAGRPRCTSSTRSGTRSAPATLLVDGIVSYRSGLLWYLMRRCPYLVAGLRRAGFSGAG